MTIEVRCDDRDIYFTCPRERFAADRAGCLETLEWGAAGMTQQRGLVREIQLPQIHDPRGDLTFVEGGNHIPFDIARVYYLYNVPVDAERGGHAHRELEQVVVALSGGFRMKVDDGITKSEYWLRDPCKGLYISKLVWREMDCFSQGAVCMVLASHRYEETDYYRNYEDFLSAQRSSIP